MSELHCLTDYDAKVLIAFNLSLNGEKQFTDFLLNNGFPELAALSAAIHSDTAALQWLLDNGWPEFAILSNAIDNEEHAIAWLDKYECTFLSTFAAACRKSDEAIKWFADNDLKLFIIIIRNIHQILLHQAWDSSDVHKRRRS
ncbi:hypothetical protein LJC68_04765 [Bacteroidales bacterium OttesenSCG-928-B11]|nr:hypothetical protein [Bacteroidales bacterium OttesenSCG-928-B11]